MNPHPEPLRCIRCRAAVGGHAGSAFYLSTEIDPLQVMSLCCRCAILACFRAGRVGKPK